MLPHGEPGLILCRLHRGWSTNIEAGPLLALDFEMTDSKADDAATPAATENPLDRINKTEPPATIERVEDFEKMPTIGSPGHTIVVDAPPSQKHH